MDDKTWPFQIYNTKQILKMRKMTYQIMDLITINNGGNNLLLQLFDIKGIINYVATTYDHNDELNIRHLYYVNMCQNLIVIYILIVFVELKMILFENDFISQISI
jgi:hypothetical protein